MGNVKITCKFEISNMKDLLREIAEDGKRLSSRDAMMLYQEAPLAQLGAAAFSVRQRIVPGNNVSYLVDRNINYTNVCNSDCSFCGFYRHDPKDPESYVLTKDQIKSKVEEAIEYGATRILLQGGHNDELKFDFYLDLISWLNSNFKIELNCFSPSEIHQMHLVSGLDYRSILTQLKSAGMAGLPGGGGEILDDEVRRRVSPKKISGKIWLEVMEIAHELALTTSATMVIGFGETLENRIKHLELLRDLQDISLSRGSKGFNAFISWVLQANENTSMGRSRYRDNYGASSSEYLRNLAIARLFLDNIIHHQSSWPTMGPEVAQLGLHFGCDDFGSTMMEENVVSQAGALTKSKWSMTPEELRSHITDAGFNPVQRNTAYQLIG